ncbi:MULTISPECIES: TetR/AcrR family transcriptional regulator [Streptomyces]|uniref:TetR/AcrR family transcriptional regulator n=1 Tax=Streptomyces rhizosphaericola TaxID=2564098 RepID=A0ABY2P998_9ACTN|nr:MULTISPECIES: TetR/AcrR family transcriptional regulator [Streptomyces]MYT99678.1 TetR family transcriptional regulator [Streptomyces sp. SID8350]TGZ03619.1 TetR/AcrR family transcriptional regulator [Streptomyces rhizosphaericola]SCK56279.1 transcriptional regulator, TetR family [Streptomyces sp. AmelKG-D3]
MERAQPGPRARYREQTRAEIKNLALRQLAEGGGGALALTRIAKEMGLSGPALYRYFTSRDDLLSALIRDAYEDAAAAMARAAARSARGSRGGRARLHDLAAAYRAWAVAEPHRYLLIQGDPVPGYVAPADTLERARAVLGPFLPLFAAGKPGPAVAGTVEEMAAWLAADGTVGAWVARYAPDAVAPGLEAGEAGTAVEAGTARASGEADAVRGTRTAGVDRAAASALAGAVLAWTQVHGSVSLEVAGQFTGMAHRGGTLLGAHMELLADAFGLE